MVGYLKCLRSLGIITLIVLMSSICFAQGGPGGGGPGGGGGGGGGLTASNVQKDTTFCSTGMKMLDFSYLGFDHSDMNWYVLEPGGAYEALTNSDPKYVGAEKDATLTINNVTTDYAGFKYQLRKASEGTPIGTFTILGVSNSSVAAMTPSGTIRICGSGAQTFTATISTVDYSIQWRRGGVDIAGATSQSYTATQAGVYTYTSTPKTSACALGESSSSTLSFGTKPVVDLIYAGSDTVCQGSHPVLQAKEGPGYSYVWRKNGGAIPNSNNPVFTATESGNYSYMASNNGCSAYSGTQSLFFLEVEAKSVGTPKNAICQDSTTYFEINNSQNKVWYSVWDQHNNVVAGPIQGSGTKISLPTGALRSSRSLTTRGLFVNSGAFDQFSLRTIQEDSTFMVLGQSSIPSGAFSLSFWLKTEHLNGGVFSMVKGAFGTQGSDLDIFLKEGGLNVQFKGATLVVDSAKGISNGAWHHVVLASTGSKLNLFLDGKPIRSVDQPSGASFSSDSLLLGFSRKVSPSFFNGELDEIQIWDRSLDSAFIAKNAQLQKPESISNLKFQLSFEEGISGANINAKLGPTSVLVNGKNIASQGFGVPMAKLGSALHINGGNAYGIVEPAFTDYQDELTIEARINFNGKGLTMGQTIKGALNKNHEIWKIYPRNSGNQFRFELPYKGTYYGVNSPDISNGWHNIAVVVNGANILLYVDGVLEASNLTFTSDSDFKIQNFQGAVLGLGVIPNSIKNSNFITIDELRIWNVARNQVEIHENMDACVYSNSVVGLAAHYLLNQTGSNPTIKDASSNGKDGVVIGASGAFSWINGIDVCELNYSGCETIVNSTITLGVNEHPSVDMVRLDPLSNCPGDTVRFVAKSNTGTNFQWYKNTVVFSGQTSDTLKVVGLGSFADNWYKVKAEDAIGCSTLSSEQWARFYSIQNQEVKVDTNKLCVGDSTTVRTSNSETDFTYFLRNESTKKVVGVPQKGTNDTALAFPTSSILENMEYSVIAGVVNPGDTGVAVKLDGTNDYIELPNSTIQTLTNGTICAWVYFNTPQFEHYNDVHGPIMCQKTSSGVQAFLGLSSFSPVDSKVVWRPFNDSITVLKSDANMSAGWNHIAITFNNSTGKHKMYLNGALSDTATVQGTFANSTEPLSLGHVPGTPVYAEFLLDEFQVWNRVMMESEIKTWKSYCREGNEEGLIQYLPMVSGSGNVIPNGVSGAPNASIKNGVSNENWAPGEVKCITCQKEMSVKPSVTANPVPTAVFSPLGVKRICEGDTVKYTSSTQTDVSYQWVMNGTPISGATSANYEALDSGLYSVVVTHNDGCSATSRIDTVKVNSLPIDQSEIYTQSDVVLCGSDSVLLSNLKPQSGSVLSWIKDGVQFAQSNSSIWVKEQGVYSFSVKDSNNCVAVSGKQYVFKPNLGALQFSLSDSEVCYGLPVEIEFSEEPNGVGLELWDKTQNKKVEIPGLSNNKWSFTPESDAEFQLKAVTKELGMKSSNGQNEALMYGKSGLLKDTLKFDFTIIAQVDVLDSNKTVFMGQGKNLDGEDANTSWVIEPNGVSGWRFVLFKNGEFHDLKASGLTIGVHWLAVVVSQNEIKMFVDGVEQAQKGINTSKWVNHNPSTQVILGKDPRRVPGTTYSSNNVWNHFAIVPSQVSAANLQALASCSLSLYSVSDKSLHFDFNNLEGIQNGDKYVLKDVSGMGNSGEVVVQGTGVPYGFLTENDQCACKQDLSGTKQLKVKTSPFGKLPIMSSKGIFSCSRKAQVPIGNTYSEFQYKVFSKDATLLHGPIAGTGSFSTGGSALRPIVDVSPSDTIYVTVEHPVTKCLASSVDSTNVKDGGNGELILANFYVADSACVSDTIIFVEQGVHWNLFSTSYEYLWTFGDGTTSSSEAHPKKLYPNPGRYTTSLEITHKGGKCPGVSVEKEILITACQKRSFEDAFIQGLNLFPNPSNGATTLEFSLFEEADFIVQFFSMGRLLKSFSSTGYGWQKLNIEDLPKGLVFITISTAFETKSLKLLVQ